jgi:hypothetical protein
VKEIIVTPEATILPQGGVCKRKWNCLREEVKKRITFEFETRNKKMVDGNITVGFIDSRCWRF